MAKNKKSSLGLILGLATIVLVIVGFCMCFTNGLLFYETSATGVTGRIDFSGLGIVFGGTHPYIITIESIIGGGSSSVDADYPFSIVALLAFVFPLCGAVICLLSSFLKDKLATLVSGIGLILELAGVVMLFFIVPQFNSAAGIEGFSASYGTTFIVTIVCYILGLLASAGKLVLVDLKK